MTIPLQTSVVYGPMRSRRFGTSLGINLLPGSAKVCNFDCLYCQYSESHETSLPQFPSLKKIEKEVALCLESSGLTSVHFDWIMIAGNGEPTLHPEFSEAVEILIQQRDLNAPGVPIGILSNSSTCHRPVVREALRKLDRCFMKLDAGSENLFKNVNRPLGANAWKETLQGLSSMGNIVLQSMFVEGRVSNTGEQSVNDWTALVKSISPRAVQVYTLDREPADTEVQPVAHDMLLKIASYVEQRAHVPAVVYA